jgi:uncharacterized protein (TIRG00374 family)
VGKGTFKLLLLLIVGIILVSFNKTRKGVNAVILWLPQTLFFVGPDVKKKIQNRICSRVVSFVENIATGFMLVKYPAKMCICIGLTIVIWILAAFSYYLMSLGCPGIELSFIEITATMVILCFFIALPSVPGYWGIWEAGGVFALLLFGVSSKAAAGFTLANHAVQVFPIIIVGFISAILTSVNIWQVSYEKSPNRVMDTDASKPK